jgi:hypothetical protein
MWDTIQFYIAVVREGHSSDSDCDFNTTTDDHGANPIHDGTMDYSIWPMYYDRPAKDMAGASVIIYGDSYINSYTHQWSEWTTTKQPTCTTDGTESRSCNYCEVTEDRILCSPGHSYNDATCELAATCTRCGATTGSNLGHSMSSWSVVTPSSCYLNGTQIRSCSRPGCSYSENGSLPLNPNNHSGGSYWTVTTAATCTASGIRSQKCYGCNAVLSTHTISALGHNWGSWIYQYIYYDEDLQYSVRVYKRTCSRCGAVEYDYLK